MNTIESMLTTPGLTHYALEESEVPAVEIGTPDFSASPAYPLAGRVIAPRVSECTAPARE